MKLWVLVYDEHYSKYLDTNHLEKSADSLRAFLSTIGTSHIAFQEPTNGLRFLEPPSGSCIRLRTPEQYVKIVHETLFQSGPQDKSERSSSCVIV
jgi:hypothetical protein